MNWFSDAALMQVLRQYEIDVSRAVDRENKAAADIFFSSAFEQRMEKLLARRHRPLYTVFRSKKQRIISILVAVLLLLSVTVLSVGAIREPLFDFIVETYEKCSYLLFPEENIQPNSIVFTPRSPKYVPSGFSQTSKTEEIFYAEYQYEDTQGNILWVYQDIKDGAKMMINTENVEYKKVLLQNGGEALVCQNKGQWILAFSDSEYVYTVHLSGSYPESELIKVAASIQ